MRKYTWFALLCGAALMTACGGDDGPMPDSNIMGIPDARPTADAAPVPDAPMPVDCDTFNQDCLDPVNSKCTMICNTSACDSLERTCLAPTGANAAGESCLRDPLTGNLSVGHDDCAAGLWCSGLGFPDDPMFMLPTMRACRPWCRASTDCDPANGVHCVGLGMLSPQDGFCLPTCPIFGTTCTSGMSCQYLGTVEGSAGPVVGFCGTPGPVGVNGECEDAECGPNLICINTTPATCLAMCDTAGGAAGTHPCTASTCQQLGSAPTGFGFCM